MRSYFNWFFICYAVFFAMSWNYSCYDIFDIQHSGNILNSFMHCICSINSMCWIITLLLIRNSSSFPVERALWPTIPSRKPTGLCRTQFARGSNSDILHIFHNGYWDLTFRAFCAVCCISCLSDEVLIDDLVHVSWTNDIVCYNEEWPDSLNDWIAFLCITTGMQNRRTTIFNIHQHNMIRPICQL